MHRYAQIDENGHVISDSYLSGIVKASNMVSISDDFDLANKKYEKGVWVDYIPSSVESEISDEEIQAQILLNQTEIIAKQNEQDEVIATILLNQMGGGVRNV